MCESLFSDELVSEALVAIYAEVDSNDMATRVPIIGITCNHKPTEMLTCVANPYVEAIQRAGGAAVLLPMCVDSVQLSSLLDGIDGLLLTGGGDFSNRVLGEAVSVLADSPDPVRDATEFALVRMALQRQIPIFGICRGHQLLNLALGGTLYQDIPSEYDGISLVHSQKTDKRFPSHEVTLHPGSLVARLMGKTSLLVNSIHHQAVKDVAPSLVGSGKATDGINEAIESRYYPVYGVQWHPEQLLAGGDDTQLPLFRHLVCEAQVYHEARAFHRAHMVLDSHCDTPMFFPEGADIGLRDNRLKYDMPKMKTGDVDAVCMVAYIPQGDRGAEDLENATKYADEVLYVLHNQIVRHSTSVEQVRTPEDVLRVKREGKRSIFMGIENAYAIGRDITNLRRYRNMGVVYMTLCHNGDNDICDSAKGADEHGGLSAFGREVVQEMNRIGMIVDMAHASERSFYDALATSSTPIVSTHSSCRALCDHSRNLTDDQIRALADRGGVIQICLYRYFLTNNGVATIDDIVAHIDHVVRLVGVDYVGVGSDFDGGGGIPGCSTAEELINITKALLRKGYTHDMLEKIWGGNFLRVMSQVQEAAEICP